jgi:hypothetical protein
MKHPLEKSATRLPFPHPQQLLWENPDPALDLELRSSSTSSSPSQTCPWASRVSTVVKRA